MKKIQYQTLKIGRDLFQKLANVQLWNLNLKHNFFQFFYWLTKS